MMERVVVRDCNPETLIMHNAKSMMLQLRGMKAKLLIKPINAFFMNTKKFKFNADKLELLSNTLQESDRLSDVAANIRGGAKNWAQLVWLEIIIIIYY
jgi:hypothetical protein